MVKPIKKLQIGKNGLTDGAVEQIRSCFENEDSVKVEMLRSCCRDKAHAKELGDELVEKLGKNFTYKLIGYVLSVRKWRQAQR